MTEHFRNIVCRSFFAAIFTCTVFVTANHGFQSISDESDQDWYNKGVKQLSGKKFEDAIYSFTKCLVINSNNADCPVKRGAAYSRSDKYIAALADLDKAVEIAPGNPTAQFERGKLAIGDYSIPFYSKAIELKPDFADACFERALTYSFTDKVKAFNDYNKTIELDPSYLEAYIGRGNIHQLNDELELAIADYSSAIRIEPNSRTYYIRALTYFDFGKYSPAI